MRARTIILAGAASILVAGAAMANARHHVFAKAQTPAIVEIAILGQPAPESSKYAFIPAAQFVPAGQVGATDPFAELDRMVAEMQQRHEALMQQMAAMQAQAASAAAQGGAGVGQGGLPGQMPGQMIVTGTMPAGSSYSYTVVSTTNGKGASCTQTIEYRSTGASNQPQVTRASSGDCDSVQRNEKPLPVSVPAPQAPAAKPFDPRTI